jgi:hypothetical protein
MYAVIHAQFSKEEMTKALKKKNIVYTHIEKLGGRRKNIVSKNVRPKILLRSEDPKE